MAAIIKSRTFSSVVDNRIQLSNSCCARAWSSSLGTSWTKIRVGARISMTNTGADFSGARLAFGIQSGTTNLFLDASGPTHWCGIVSTTASWTYGTQGGIPRYYAYPGIADLIAGKKVGTTLTTTGSSGDFNVIFDATQAYRGCFFVDIMKGSPNFTFSLFRFNIANAFIASDCSLATYLANVILPSPVVANHAATGNITLAVDEATNGYFNAVGFSWDRSDVLIELSDVTVVRLS